MTLKRQLLLPLGCIGIAALLGVAWGARGAVATEPDGLAQLPNVAAEQRVTLEIEMPEPLAKPKEYGGKENCLTGCSLAKHAIAPFTDAQYQAALRGYASAGIDEPSKALEQLLFYGKRTLALMDQYGTAPLPPQHLAFLKRELARNRAIVSLRFVNADGRVRVNLAPVTVPIGIKQHLHPTALGGTQPMEINGTVMRTGLYHLWSRY